MEGSEKENTGMDNIITCEFQPLVMESIETSIPEKDLWSAVLNQAIWDAKTLIQRLENDPGLWRNPLFRSEVLYLHRFFRMRSMEIGSFSFICDLMGWNPDLIARRIHEKYLQHLIQSTERTTRMASLAAA